MPYKPSDALLPLTPVAFEILLALAEENLHGYAILRAVEGRLGGLLPLRTGTLYRSLARLLEADLIDEIPGGDFTDERSEEHTSELQSRLHPVCRLLLEKNKARFNNTTLSRLT